MDEVWDPVGVWNVTTEGDCEGRTTENLGTHKGHIADIARELADQAYYGLYFARVKTDEIPVPRPSKAVSVTVHLDIASGTWNLDQDKRVAYFKEMMKSRKDVSVAKSTSYASVTLTLKPKRKVDITA